MKTIENIKTTELKNEDCIEFVSRTKNLGMAVFQFCPVFKYGKLREMHIFRGQQEEKEHFILKVDGKKSFTINGYEGLDDPKIWQFHYCKEHAQSFRANVPCESKYIKFVEYSDHLSIMFLKTK